MCVFSVHVVCSSMCTECVQLFLEGEGVGERKQGRTVATNFSDGNS